MTIVSFKNIQNLQVIVNRCYLFCNDVLIFHLKLFFLVLLLCEFQANTSVHCILFSFHTKRYTVYALLGKYVLLAFAFACLPFSLYVASAAAFSRFMLLMVLMLIQRK